MGMSRTNAVAFDRASRPRARLRPAPGATAAFAHRLRHEPYRPARRQRQGGIDLDADLGRGRQRQGRHSRPQGGARLLRRPDQSLDGAKYLHQAARRRQGRPDRVGLRHERDRPRDADRDAAEHGVHGAVRPERQLEVQLRSLLPDHARRAGTGHRLDTGLFRYRDGSHPEATKRLPSWARMPSIRRWRWKGPARRSSGPD